MKLFFQSTSAQHGTHTRIHWEFFPILSRMGGTIALLALVLGACSLVACECSPNAQGAPPEKEQNQTTTKHPLPEVSPDKRTAVTNARLHNSEAPIPSQCYTKTEGRQNPCYTCHQNYERKVDARLNELDDGGNQGAYTFSDVGFTNHWTNLFIDKRAWTESVSDEEILRYVDQENYSSLREKLHKSKFAGFVPDLRDYQNGKSAFDQQGLAKDGSHWVAFNYKPFPGTFWPTNGSADDVLVRLPQKFRELDGKFDRDTYYINLTLVELNIKRDVEVELWPISEKRWSQDLDGDGKVSETSQVRLSSKYVGDARGVLVEPEQFPQGTELLHSVRYLSLHGNQVVPARRMKELRYMRKVNVLSRETLSGRYAGERKEKRLGQLPNYLNRGDEGYDNALGWFIQGFIEDYDGDLRAQTVEEGLFCMGCHSAIGTTLDSTFSMGRKVPGGKGFGYVDTHGMADAPSRGEPGGEILNYLRRAGGGSEFRENAEMRERWYDADGNVREAQVTAADVRALITPSKKRALELNKAYAYLVRHQSFRLGRDANLEPARNVFAEVDEHAEPLVPEARFLGWDIRLNWSAPSE